MVLPSRGISHQSNLSVQLLVIMYSQLLCSLHLLHKRKCCMIFPLRNSAKYQWPICAIYKFFLNMWTWIMRNFYFIIKNYGIFLYKIKWNISIEISQHWNFEMPLSLKWMCVFISKKILLLLNWNKYQALWRRNLWVPLSFSHLFSIFIA